MISWNENVDNLEIAFWTLGFEIPKTENMHYMHFFFSSKEIWVIFSSVIFAVLFTQNFFFVNLVCFLRWCFGIVRIFAVLEIWYMHQIYLFFSDCLSVAKTDIHVHDKKDMMYVLWSILLSNVYYMQRIKVFVDLMRFKSTDLLFKLYQHYFSSFFNYWF